MLNHRNIYGRRLGKHFTQKDQNLLDQDLPKLALTGVSLRDNPDRDPKALKGLWNDGRKLWLEIGFGGGEHLLHQAHTHPEIGLIGCETFLAGVASAVKKSENLETDNLRLYAYDVQDLLELLPEESLDRVFLLYPDPWPKKRHNKRRMIDKQRLAPIHRVLRTGGELRIASDIDDYIAHSLQSAQEQGFEWLAQTPKDWINPWDNWYQTRYEAKALIQGRVPTYLRLVKTKIG